MAVNVFKSTDAGAPTLNGTAGALITVLDALLINGYNQQTGVTATRTGGTATFTKTSHGYVVDQLLTITGFTTADYNITGKVLSTPDANTWTMAVSSGAASPAVGTGTVIVAPVGWTKSYSGTNKAAYRQKTGTNQFYLRVDDTNAQNSQVRGYETMSDVDTGTNPFPTTTQIALGSGLYVYKSITADATARTWQAYSNGKMLYFMGQHGTSTPRSACFAFGDFLSRLPGDTYNTIIIAETTASVTGAPVFTMLTSAITSATAGHYIARPYTGVAGALNCAKASHYSLATGNHTGNAGGTYPDPIAGGINLGVIFIGESASVSTRGILPGLWNPLHATPLSNGDKFSGAAGSDLAGIRFEYRALYNTVSGGVIVFDLTGDTWETAYG